MTRWMVLCLFSLSLIPRTALAREGTLAVVNLGSAGHEVVLRASETLKDSLGGWAKQAGMREYLAAKPNAGAMAGGDAGKEITVLVERVRSKQASAGELASLGRLIGVDYLMLIAVRGRGYTARLFSVHRLAYAPETFDSRTGDTSQLRLQLREQTRPPPKTTAKSWLKKWWVLGLVGVVGGVTLGLALANRDSSTGDLRIRVSH